MVVCDAYGQHLYHYYLPLQASITPPPFVYLQGPPGFVVLKAQGSPHPLPLGLLLLLLLLL